MGVRSGMGIGLAACVLASLAACGEGPAGVVGGKAREQFYVAPPKLELRDQLGLQAGVSGIALHGDVVEILERRRRFARVRLATGVAGWVDTGELLSEQQWAKLERLAGQSAGLPVQAVAAPFDKLNIHTDPNRGAPTFYIAAEEEPVEIIGHIVTPRVDHDPRYAAGYDPSIVPPDAPLDDWQLVRLNANQIPTSGQDARRAGWVLSRLLYIKLPDTVTQQANRAAIMAAIPLGMVNDEGEDHQHWLMATIAERNRSFDFDTLRVMAWNTARHRYDVNFLEKDLTGYYPIETAAAGKGSALSDFVVTVGTGELTREKRRYVFPASGYRPKATVVDTITMPKPEPPKREDYSAPAPPPVEAPKGPNYWERVRERWHKAWGLPAN